MFDSPKELSRKMRLGEDTSLALRLGVLMREKRGDSVSVDKSMRLSGCEPEYRLADDADQASNSSRASHCRCGCGNS